MCGDSEKKLRGVSGTQRELNFCKGICDLKTCLNYSYHHARTYENSYPNSLAIRTENSV